MTSGVLVGKTLRKDMPPMEIFPWEESCEEIVGAALLAEFL